MNFSPTKMSLSFVLLSVLSLVSCKNAPSVASEINAGSQLGDPVRQPAQARNGEPQVSSMSLADLVQQGVIAHKQGAEFKAQYDQIMHLNEIREIIQPLKKNSFLTRDQKDLLANLDRSLSEQVGSLVPSNRLAFPMIRVGPQQIKEAFAMLNVKCPKRNPIELLDDKTVHFKSLDLKSDYSAEINFRYNDLDWPSSAEIGYMNDAIWLVFETLPKTGTGNRNRNRNRNESGHSGRAIIKFNWETGDLIGGEIEVSTVLQLSTYEKAGQIIKMQTMYPEGIMVWNCPVLRSN